VKLIKLSQFKKQINHIANYFVLDYGEGQEPDISPYNFFVSSETFRNQLNKQNIEQKLPSFNGKIIHVCYDMSSNKLYFPEFNSVKELSEIRKNGILEQIKMAISFFNSSVSALNIGGEVAGNPNQTFRIRKVGNFFSAASYIKKNIYGHNEYGKEISNKVPFNPELLVVEANLSDMPKTASYLGVNQKEESFFEPESKRVIAFIKTIGNNDQILYTLKGPFILINTSRGAQISGAEKERLVVENYNKYIESKKSIIRLKIFSDEQKEYFTENGYPTEKINKIESSINFEINRTEYLLSLGWSVEDMCKLMINPKSVTKCKDLLGVGGVGHIIDAACKEIEKKGYPNPLKNYYYYIVKRSKTFPFKVDEPNAGLLLQVVGYDPQEDLVTLRSKLYIKEDVCKQILSTDNVTIVSYLTENTLFRSTKNIKDDKKIINSAKLMIGDVKKNLSFDEKKKFDFEQIVHLPQRLCKFDFKKRKISDFYQAAEKIKTNCKRTQKITGKQVDFEDLTVYVGPLGLIEKGMKGGYIPPGSKTRPDGSVDVIPGVLQDMKFFPRNILIDTLTSPSVADQYDAIIHEYQHDINRRVGIPEPKYEMPGGDIVKMLKYLNDPDERESHITQSMILADSGLSKDQIIQRFLGEQIPNNKNLVIAKKYDEFVEEASKRLEMFYEQETKEDQKKQVLDKLENETPEERVMRLRKKIK